MRKIDALHEQRHGAMSEQELYLAYGRLAFQLIDDTVGTVSEQFGSWAVEHGANLVCLFPTPMRISRARFAEKDWFNVVAEWSEPHLSGFASRRCLRDFELAYRWLERAVPDRASIERRTMVRSDVSRRYERLFITLGRRDGFMCQACGESAKDLQIDHRVPVAMGGGNDLDNLQLLCAGCNARKGARVVH